jgi:L-cysteine:1D-myo-inositol 2-amino-2-deoxy-alpha-D-glucopyranoside ligase
VFVPVLEGARGLLPSVYDTASRRVASVGPEEGTARLYVCGITPYDATHLGHANTYLAFDTLQRAWLDAGLAVSYAQNVTDVDDPLLERANATGVDWRALATSQIALFRSDMEALRILPPQHYVGVTESLATVVSLVEALRDRGLAYQIADNEYPDWYFRCSHVPTFGTVARLRPDETRALFAERGGDPERPGKDDPYDCLLWRLERPGEPAWDSSLGRGRPGWHVECTAIALEDLGESFDVQGGGSDLVYPHHEMCAAEASGATGHPLAKSYVHAGMVGYHGEKMSKSKGNLVFVSGLLRDGADPMAIRLALLNHQYRTDWEWTSADLADAEQRLASWRTAAAAPRGVATEDTIEAIRQAIRDDLDTPSALRAVDIWAAASFDLDEGDDPEGPRRVSEAVDALLGIALR